MERLVATVGKGLGHIGWPTVLVVITATLYAWSSAHYNAYIRVFDLNTAMMERSFYGMLYTGFLLVWDKILYVLAYLFACSLIVVWVQAMASILLPKTYAEKRGWVKAIKVLRTLTGVQWLRNVLFKKWGIALRDTRTKNNTRRKNASEAASVVLLYVTGTLLLSFMFYMLSLMWFEAVGRDKGKADLARFDDPDRRGEKMIWVGQRPDIPSLFFLSCGAQHCAGIDPDAREVYYFAKNHGFHFALRR